MRHALLSEHDGERTFVLILSIGDEIIACLEDFAEREQLRAAQLSAIGAFSDAVLGYFDWSQKDYLRLPIDEQVEVASLNGDVAEAEAGHRVLHLHAVLGKRDGTALAGHLLAGHVRPTLELMLTESPAHLRRIHDPATGLPLIKLPE